MLLTREHVQTCFVLIESQLEGIDEDYATKQLFFFVTVILLIITVIITVVITLILIIRA